MTRLMVKTMIPGAMDGPRSLEAVWKNPLNLAALDQPGQRVRLRLDSTAVRVEHIGDPNKAEFVQSSIQRTARCTESKLEPL